MKYIVGKDKFIPKVLFRMIIIAIRSKWIKLTAKLKSKIIIKDRNEMGWGRSGIYIYRDKIEPELNLFE